MAVTHFEACTYAGSSTDVPQVTAWNTVASYSSYAEAQAVIDRLAAQGFPVQEIEIVGSGLRIVEQVTGRMSTARAAVAGAGTGAWIGLFVGLVIGLFTVGAAWLGLMLGGILIGAAWGTLLGLAARWFGRARHDFSPLRAVVATRYDIIALDGMATRARSPLGIAG